MVECITISHEEINLILAQLSEITVDRSDYQTERNSILEHLNYFHGV